MWTPSHRHNIFESIPQKWKGGWLLSLLYLESGAIRKRIMPTILRAVSLTESRMCILFRDKGMKRVHKNVEQSIKDLPENQIF